MSNPPRRWTRRLTWTLLAVAALALVGCATGGELDSLRPAGPIAHKQMSLFTPVFWTAVVVFVVVEAILVLALFRFRDRPDAPMPQQVHGNTRLEVGWTILPALILAVIAVPTVATIFALAQEPEGAIRVEVVGHRWWWEFRYPGEDVVTANELHIPAGRPVMLTMDAYEEGGVLTVPAERGEGVIHSFWVPRLAGKQDVVPGKVSTLTLEADQPGEYWGQCAEFCGMSHANMRVRVIAHDEAGYRRWLNEQRAPAAQATGALAEGQRLFAEGACAGCHTIEGVATGIGGPNLTHFASRNRFAGSTFETNRENLREWLRDPPAMKPGSLMPPLGLTEDEIESLVDYLLSLR
ncbi:MAG TPA: cytochrome c oxidase subunit II [Actinomycetota bacterium]|nr:cytochrome c oxidase subunit II [Actinomycetota bacterium]